MTDTKATSDHDWDPDTAVRQEIAERGMTEAGVDDSKADMLAWLESHDACEEGVEWAAANCESLEDVWGTARADWLIWVARQKGVLTDRELRLFACWCVRQVWDLLPDDRSKRAVEVAELYAGGEATEVELSAARSAAWSAAMYVARSAAESAAWYAAWSVARSAAWSVARSAAESAARSAAMYAARSARSAARSAAMYAAESAAMSAARSAARSDQAEYLRRLKPTFTLERAEANR